MKVIRALIYIRILHFPIFHQAYSIESQLGLFNGCRVLTINDMITKS